MPSSHPVDPNATLIDTFPVLVEIEWYDEESQKKSCQMITNVTFWLTSKNDGEYVIDAMTSNFNDANGDGAAVDNTAASSMYELTSLKAVELGIARNHTLCPENCAERGEARVFVRGCVERHDSGTNTYFTHTTGSGWGYRTISICCPTTAGVPNLTVIERSGPSCQGSSQETCAGGQGG